MLAALFCIVVLFALVATIPSIRDFMAGLFCLVAVMASIIFFLAMLAA